MTTQARLVSMRAMNDIPLLLNGERTALDPSRRDLPLLWWLREDRGLAGTRFGCGQAACGACTVHLDGAPVRACVTPCRAAEGRQVTTIEGLARHGALHPVQRAWIDLRVPQCGYCQSGQMMAAAALIALHPRPTDAQIDTAMNGLLCRCGTYDRIRAAIHLAARIARGEAA
jgi:aerobic-type carbon monoxide dehydrogenase small subunit (CoxS/CutS family)